MRGSPLVSYVGSDEDEDVDEEAETEGPPRKKR
jgi:hypothetical protein